jgi:hypothetical protein
MAPRLKRIARVITDAMQERDRIELNAMDKLLSVVARRRDRAKVRRRKSAARSKRR